MLKQKHGQYPVRQWPASPEESAVFEFIPAIDVLEGRVVRLERGDYAEVTVYGEDPAGVAAEFISAGAPIVHVVDLEGARTGRSDPSLGQSLGTAAICFQIGGGLRSAEAARRAMADGASRVVIGTTALWDDAELNRIVEAVGAAAIVGAVDVANGRAHGAGWLDEGRPLDGVLGSLAAAGIERILVTSIDRDGMMQGPDMDLLAIAAVADMKVIASGGVGTLDDLRRVAESGLSGVIVGRAIYEGRFTVAEALAAIAESRR